MNLRTLSQDFFTISNLFFNLSSIFDKKFVYSFENKFSNLNWYKLFSYFIMPLSCILKLKLLIEFLLTRVFSSIR